MSVQEEPGIGDISPVAAAGVPKEPMALGFGEEHDRALAVYQKVAEANDHVRVVSFGNSSDPNRIADAVISMVG
jgi:hypothetical protein